MRQLGKACVWIADEFKHGDSIERLAKRYDVRVSTIEHVLRALMLSIWGV